MRLKKIQIVYVRYSYIVITYKLYVRGEIREIRNNIKSILSEDFMNRERELAYLDNN